MRLRPDQMGHGLKDVQAVGASVLLATFADGHKRLWNLRDLGEPYGVFEPLLADPALFRRFTVLDGGSGLAWPNGADVDADQLYHSGRAVYVVTMDYDAASDTLLASFRPTAGTVDVEPVCPGLSFTHDLNAQEWVGFQCAGFSTRIKDESWLGALPSQPLFFALDEPGESRTLRQALLDAAEHFLGRDGAHEPGLALAAR